MCSLPGEAGTPEAILMAAFGRIKVISVDYRMPPDFPYSAAMDDAMIVYREVVKTTPAKKIGNIWHVDRWRHDLSHGTARQTGGLALARSHCSRNAWSDMTKTGDTYFANEMVDNILVSNDGWLADAANLYANGTILRTRCCRQSMATYKGSLRRYLLRARAIFFSATQCGCTEVAGGRRCGRPDSLRGKSHAQYLFVPDAPKAKSTSLK